MQAAGEIVTSQVDLLWSVALAVLLGMIFLVGRFSDSRSGLRRRALSWFLLSVCVILQLFSMLFGYLTYGAIITMNRCTPDSAGAIDSWCSENSLNQSQSFSDAGYLALLQFGSFLFGLIIFVVLFCLESKAVAKALKQA